MDGAFDSNAFDSEAFDTGDADGPRPRLPSPARLVMRGASALTPSRPAVGLRVVGAGAPKLREP